MCLIILCQFRTCSLFLSRVASRPLSSIIRQMLSVLDPFSNLLPIYICDNPSQPLGRWRSFHCSFWSIWVDLYHTFHFQQEVNLEKISRFAFVHLILYTSMAYFNRLIENPDLKILLFKLTTSCHTTFKFFTAFNSQVKILRLFFIYFAQFQLLDYISLLCRKREWDL